MDNQKISIKTAAEGIAHVLFIGAYKDSEQIVKEIEESQKLSPSETRLGNVFVEMLHFYLNLVDRFAFQYLSDKRNELIDEVSIQVFKNHLESHKSAGGKMDEETFYRIFNETHKKRQEEYGQYKFTTGTEAGLKGNLFWEFESQLAEILETKDNLLVMMSNHAILMSTVGKLHEVCKKFMSDIIHTL